MLENMLAGLLQAFHLDMLLGISLGVIGGIVVGILPGFSTTMGVALLIPITFGMTPAVGLAMIGGMYAASCYSGSIAAILLNIPGTSSAAATMLEGHPMALKGEAGRAIALATIASSFGGNVGTLCLLFMAPPLALLALKFGALEYFLVAMFGITIIASVSERDLVKGLISGILGLFISMIGIHPLTGYERFTFGIPALYDGIPIVVAMIGLYSIPEVIDMIGMDGGSERRVVSRVQGRLYHHMLEYFRYKYIVLRACVIGVILGVAPGAGGSLAGFVAYYDAKRTSKRPELFGKGAPEGVVACETSNNAEMGGALIPTLTLGVPGSTVCAVFLGALIIHGLRPGPQLFTDNPETIYGFIFSLFLSNLFFVPLGLVTARYGSKLIEVSPSILSPTIVSLAVIGTFAINASIEDSWIMLIMGLIGYLLKRFDVPREGMLLGLVLGDLAESELARALTLVHGDVVALLIQMATRPISLILVVLCLLSIGHAVRTQHRAKKATKSSEA